MATVLQGRFFLMCEQGCGSWWAFQEEQHIKPPTAEWPHEQWSYDGLRGIQDKDYFIVLNSDGTVFWEGQISFQHGQPVYRDKWYHRLLGNVLDRNLWGEIFMRERKGTIIRD